MREDRKRAAVEALGLPRDVILGDVLLHFTGPYEVVAEISGAFLSTQIRM